MHRFLSFFFVLFASAAAFAQTPQPLHVKAEIFSPITATGQESSIPAALRLDLEEGWDTYWRTPGDAGLAPHFDWAGSDNLKSAAAQWPAPHRFTTLDLESFGYKDTVIFPVTLTPETPGQAISLKLRLDLLVCKDICVPETHSLAFTLPAGEGAKGPRAAEYQAALKRIPAAAENVRFENPALAFDGSNNVFLVTEATLPHTPSRKADLFVEHESGLIFGAPQIARDSKSGKTVFRMMSHATAALEIQQKDLTGAPFTLTYVDGDTLAEQGGLTLAATAPASVQEEETPLQSLLDVFDLRIVFFAFLGGIILNLMPCVLPVLSLKILSVVSHGGKENRRTIFRNFMASALGILCSFWLMAGILAALKSAGSTIGWGLQFQHPAFLVFLIGALALFAANMWGAFEIPLPRFIARNIPAKHEHEPTLTGHFLTGAFATLLATPCTAPFLGTAVGFALARGSFDIFVIFTFLGLGLALPYILLAVSPKLFRRMPRPGKWMVTLKKILAVALALTALWLVNVLYTISTTATLDAGWQKFDEALIAPAVADGKTVIVDVTADWCLTCKANKRLVLEQDEVLFAIGGDNFLRLQADWTHRDESISAYLKKFGRYGIPFNIVYGPGAQDGIVLPELLSKKVLLDAIALAADE